MKKRKLFITRSSVPRRARDTRLELDHWLATSERSESSGTILLDIVLAFSIALLFVAIMSGSSIEARRIFEGTKDRKENLDFYDSNLTQLANIGIDERLDLGTSSKAWGKWYGNEMKETGISIASSSMIFVGTERFRDSNTVNLDGLPICSVDFKDQSVLGSYDYLRKNLANGQTTEQLANEPIEVGIIPIYLPIDPSLPLTDLEIRHGVAYISVDSSISADPDLIIADIRDHLNPTILSSLNTGPGLSSISLVGRRVFGSAPSTVGELHTIRLDGLSNPILENRYRLPLPYATATPALGSAIFFDDNKVYLGTEKWDGEEFNILDVSNPVAPVYIGGFEVDSKINDIFIMDKVAYVTASSNDQLLVIDIEDPENPRLLTSFEPSGWERQEGKTVSFFEQRLSLGRTSGGFDMPDDHEAFAWQPISSTTLSQSTSRNILGGVYGILQDRTNIYLVTRDINKEFQIFNKDLSTSTVVFALPIAPQVMTCYLDSIFILANRAPFIYKINLH